MTTTKTDPKRNAAMMGKTEHAPQAGAIYEPDYPVAANRKAEMAIVFLAMTDAESTQTIFRSVSPRDFYYVDCRFIFSELSAMQLTSDPLPCTDPASWQSWFNRREVVERMNGAGLSDWAENKAGIVATLKIVIDGSFAMPAHLGWYIAELRKFRLARGLRSLAMQLASRVDADPTASVGILSWVEESVGQLKQLIPERVNNGTKENRASEAESAPAVQSSEAVS